jgi:hypothetical protein
MIALERFVTLLAYMQPFGSTLSELLGPLGPHFVLHFAGFCGSYCKFWVMPLPTTCKSVGLTSCTHIVVWAHCGVQSPSVA